MTKIKIEHLDLPIIRSCNLACIGCMTHSNHKKVKGIVRLDESREWLKFWAERIDPDAITLFGGEPLLHPDFVGWANTVRDIFTTTPISFNTNGYYLDTLFDKIPDLFDDHVALSMVVSYQTSQEPYLSKVKTDFETLKQRVLDYWLSKPEVKTAYWDLWLDELEINTKQWFRLVVNGVSTRIGFTTCEQYKLHWTTFYRGYGEEMLPVYEYTDNWHEQNFNRCQTNNFITLYKGRMWKCPPMGVLEHTLDTFNLKENPQWAPYLTEYKTVGLESTDEEITEWFNRTLTPERVCNMCGFAGPNGTSITSEQRSHRLKDYWNYRL